VRSSFRRKDEYIFFGMGGRCTNKKQKGARGLIGPVCVSSSRQLIMNNINIGVHTINSIAHRSLDMIA
jgi:hypothetical protein